MNIHPSELPYHSLLKKEAHNCHYVDSFQGVLTNPNIEISDIGRLFFASEPRWITLLFALRNKLAKLVGLKTPGNFKDRKAQLERFSCEPGEQAGLFKVFSKTDHEIVLGEDDKHLNFRVSLFIDPHTHSTRERKLTISTAVKFNNFFGRVYFIPVRPFHKLIVRIMLRDMLKNSKKQRHQST